MIEGPDHSLSFPPLRNRNHCQWGLSFPVLPGQYCPEAKTKPAGAPVRAHKTGDHNVICRSDA